MKKTEVKIHKVLEGLMKERGLTTAVLSKELGMPNSTLASYLSATKASYSPEHLLLIARYFNVSVDYLLSGTSSPSADLNSLPIEKLFSGWLKVRVDRVIASEEGDDD